MCWSDMYCGELGYPLPSSECLLSCGDCPLCLLDGYGVCRKGEGDAAVEARVFGVMCLHAASIGEGVESREGCEVCEFWVVFSVF